MKSAAFQIGNRTIRIDGQLANVLENIAGMRPFLIEHNIYKPDYILIHGFSDAAPAEWNDYLSEYGGSQNDTSETSGAYAIVTVAQKVLKKAFSLDPQAVCEQKPTQVEFVTGIGGIRYKFNNDFIIYAMPDMIAGVDINASIAHIISNRHSIPMASFNDGTFWERIWYWSASNLLFPAMKETFLLHGCGILGADRQAILFIGHSGAGKTTIARLCKEHYKILNDDTVIASCDNGNWILSGTPWIGREATVPGLAKSAPLKAIAVLVQADNNSINRIAGVHKKGIELTKHIATKARFIGAIPSDNIDSLLSLAEKVPMFELHFNRAFDLRNAPALLLSAACSAGLQHSA
jgi:hypothetical protein